MIIDHNHPLYKQRWENVADKFNGALFYSQEIVNNIIPRVKTDRSWITVNIPLHNNVPQFEIVGCDHAIVFIHNNKHPKNYEWLSRYKDLILICGVPETCEKVAHLGKAVYLPLSIDVDYVQTYLRPKTKGTAFVGRKSKRKGLPFPDDVDIIEDMPRDELLWTMAQYEKVYAVGRVAIEAKALGCEVLPMPEIMDDRYPDPDMWQVYDNKDMARLLQEILIDIDGKVIIDHTDPEYEKRRAKLVKDRYNGAFFYSQEIVRNIIPNVKTDRNWITIKAGEKGANHSICFVHNNVKFEEAYAYMRNFSDVVYVVGLPDMVKRAEKFGKTIYLPLSVDVDYVKQFRRPKEKECAFVGRRATRRDWAFPEGTDFIECVPRHELLAQMGKYKKVYAIGRTAIEAKVLGCEVLPFHPRLMDPDLWQVVDSFEASQILQRELDKIDEHNTGDA